MEHIRACKSGRVVYLNGIMPDPYRALFRFPLLIASALFALSLAACAGGARPAGQDRPAAASPAAAGKPVAVVKTVVDYSKLGADYLAKGDLENAYKCYALAEDKAALGAMQDRLLKAGSYELYARCWQELRKSVVMRDEFADNAQSWNLRSDDYGTSAIEGGKLAIKRSHYKGTSYFWPTAKLDPALDFKIEALVDRKAGDDNKGVFIAWGLKDSDDNFMFGISGDGSYLYGGYAGGAWTTKLNWKDSAAINKGFAANKLAVLRSGPALEFYINDTLVDRAAFEALPDLKFGLGVATGLEVDAERFRVEQYPAASELWNAAGADAQYKADLAAAVRYYTLAGNAARLGELADTCAKGGQVELAIVALKGAGSSDYSARMMVASILAASGDKAGALAQLKSAGWSLDKGLSRPLLQEDFSDNSGGWAVLSNQDAALLVKNGAYRFQSLAADGWNTWKSVPINPESDFKIEATIRTLAGPADRSSSLIWGFKESSEKQDFGVRGDGGFEYAYFVGGTRITVLNSAKCPGLRPGAAANLLAVVRSGDKQRLFVNGAKVGEVPFRAFSGDNIGFSLYARATMEADSISVTEYPPDFAIELARTELYASRPADFAKEAASIYLDRGMYDEAVASFLQAGPSAEAYRGLAAAYEALGQADKAQAAKAKLADLLFADGKSDEALALYLEAAKPAVLDTAGLRYFGAGDFVDAAALFKAAGDGANEKACYGRLAEARLKAGNIVEAASLYRKAGDEAKAADAEKRLTSLSASPQLLAPDQGSAPEGHLLWAQDRRLGRRGHRGRRPCHHGDQSPSLALPKCTKKPPMRAARLPPTGRARTPSST